MWCVLIGLLLKRHSTTAQLIDSTESGTVEEAGRHSKTMGWVPGCIGCVQGLNTYTALPVAAAAAAKSPVR